ncbi:MAG: sugar phosphate isomerase/epimerase [Proteobacteria bacterium]|nr:sugar phosphate isomerase/epimerase [Pseudomonadota bacterium]
MNELYLAPTTLMHTPPLEFLMAAEKAGYDGVGLRLYRSPNLPYFPIVGDDALIDAIKAILARSKMRVLDLLSFYMLPTTDLADMGKALAVGAEFGARYAIVQGNDPDWARMRRNFMEFCDRAADNGMIAALEFMPARSLSNLERALRLIEESGRSNAIICIDPLHLIRSGGTPAALAKVDRKLLPYAQLTDGLVAPGEADPMKIGRAEMGPGTRALPGEGNLPLAAILDALPAGLPLSVELMPPEGAPVVPEVWAKHAIDVTRRYMSARAAVSG